MNKEELLKYKESLFKKYTSIYRGYLYGSKSNYNIDEITERIIETVHNEVSSVEEVEPVVRASLKRIKDIEEKVREKYETEIVKPLTEELLDLLQFKGLVKGTQYRKKAEEIKKKLKKYDGVFTIRHRALMRFFNSKMGSKYRMIERLFIVLALGALDTKNI